MPTDASVSDDIFSSTATNSQQSLEHSFPNETTIAEYIFLNANGVGIKASSGKKKLWDHIDGP